MCNYEHEYFDFSEKMSLLFKCKEKDVKDGFCIFHHPRYWKEFPKNVIDRLHQKVAFSIKNNEELQCIGYNLPMITFSGLLFAMPVDFSYSKFHEMVDFSTAVFNETANFSRATFNGEVRFSGVTFKGKAIFCGVTFNGIARFRATFKGRATFLKATFNGEVRFSKATFSEIVYFRKAIFNNKAYFSEIEFTRAYFFRAIFNNKAYFSKTRIGINARFSGAKFHEVEFVGLVRQKDGVLSTNDPVLIFEDATFNNPKNTRFDQLDLSNVSFVLTDISQIDIGENVRWDANKKLLDERRAEKGEVSYEKVATVYRRLRQNLESKLRYAEAGRFFIAEMEVKRKNVKTKNRVLRWLRTNFLSALAWYKYFSNYGENYQRVILWIVLTPFAAALLTTLFITPLPYLSRFPVNFQDYINRLNQFFINFQSYYSDYLFAFFQLKSDNFGELALRMFSLLLMGQLYIALRRQFERRGKETPAT
ncbi:pentapeptide repeat-containing protein [Candidatus Bathyarchaeota archaeon]|nr:pentapeptide repeat-containing protein [Candidatus Bathyarchaeota archaeon]